MFNAIHRFVLGVESACDLIPCFINRLNYTEYRGQYGVVLSAQGTEID